MDIRFLKPTNINELDAAEDKFHADLYDEIERLFAGYGKAQGLLYDRIRLVSNEVASNIIKHDLDAKRIVVKTKITADKFTLRINHDGAHFDRQAIDAKTRLISRTLDKLNAPYVTEDELTVGQRERIAIIITVDLRGSNG